MNPRRLNITILLALAALLISSAAIPLTVSASELNSFSPYAAMTESSRAGVMERTKGDLPAYSVQATLSESPSGASIDGEIILDFVNWTTEALDQLYFRLYPNLELYEEGSLELSDILVDGVPAASELTQGDTLLTILLERTLDPGDSVSIQTAFFTSIPVDPVENYGMFEYETESKTYKLSHWLPLIAGWDEQNGWETGEILFRGDPVFASFMFFDVTLDAPETLTFATTGSEAESKTSQGRTTYRWISGPVREFVMLAGESLTMISTIVGETTVRSFSSPETLATSSAVLDMTAESLRIFTEMFGPYPFQELDIAEAVLGPGAAGIEFPGLMYIGVSVYDDTNDFLEFTVAHEVAHQWWYGLVGNNQYIHAYLDESLTNYTAVLYLEARYGPEGKAAGISLLERTYFSALFGREGDAVVDQPTADFDSSRSYGRIVYGKGALGFDQLRADIGDDAFFLALSSYFDEYQFTIASPPSLQLAFESASDRDLSVFWDHWFLSANGAQDFSPSDMLDAT